MKGPIACVVFCGLALGVAARGQQPTQWDGVFSAAQADRGRALYGQHCANCHGADLRGLPQPVTYPGQSPRTPSLAGEKFASNFDGVTLADLATRIRISMPQNKPGSLTRDLVTDVLAYMLQTGGYPAGVRELPARTDDLAAIRFLSARP